MNELEVRFDIWCAKCKHRNVNDNEDPCDHCLEYPFNEDSTKPVDYEEY